MIINFGLEDYVASIGNVSADAIRKYIEEQGN